MCAEYLAGYIYIMESLRVYMYLHLFIYFAKAYSATLQRPHIKHYSCVWYIPITFSHNEMKYLDPKFGFHSWTLYMMSTKGVTKSHHTCAYECFGSAIVAGNKTD